MECSADSIHVFLYMALITQKSTPFFRIIITSTDWYILQSTFGDNQIPWTLSVSQVSYSKGSNWRSWHSQWYEAPQKCSRRRHQETRKGWESTPRHLQEGLLSCKQHFPKSFGFDIAGPHTSKLLLSKNSHYLLFLRMLFHDGSQSLASTSIPCLLPIYCMNSN